MSSSIAGAFGSAHRYGAAAGTSASSFPTGV